MESDAAGKKPLDDVAGDWNRGRPLKFREKLAFGVGRGGTLMLSSAFLILIKPFYVPSRGKSLVKPEVVGNILLFGRVIDAISDPLIGFLSDRTGTRWGRRIPFMALSALPLCLTFILLFTPLTRTQSLFNTLWLAVIQGLFWLFFTGYTCPLLGLIPAIAKTDVERLNLQTVSAYMIGICGGIGVVAAPMLKDSLGFQFAALALAALGGLMFYCPVFAIRELDFGESRPASFPFKIAMRETFRNKPFLRVLVSMTAFRFGFNIILSGIIYYVELLMGIPAERSGAATSRLMFVFFGVACATFPAANLAARRFGKKKLVIFGGLGLGLTLPALYLLPNPPLGISPLNFGHLIVIVGGIFLSTLLMLNDVVMADVVDLDAYHTGQRREAMYYGAVGLAEKSAIGISEWFMMFMIGRYDRLGNKALGVRLTGPVCGLITLLSLLFFIPYPERFDPATRQWTLLPPRSDK